MTGYFLATQAHVHMINYISILMRLKLNKNN